MLNKKEIASSQLQSGWDAAMKAANKKPSHEEVMAALEEHRSAFTAV